MAAVFEKPSLWRRVSPLFGGFDALLLFALLMLAGAGLLTMYSSGYDHGTRFNDHGRNMLIAASIMFVVAQIPQQRHAGGIQRQRNRHQALRRNLRRSRCR